jgi:hypothetical protein
MYVDDAHREERLDLTECAPSDAIRLLAHTIWTHVRENPGWLCLINNENLHEGRYVRKLEQVSRDDIPIR